MADVHVYTLKAKLKALLVLTLAAAALGLGLELTVLSHYSLKTLDLLFRHLPLAPASREVVLITVDQPDLDFFKDQGVNWPWPRELYAPLIEFCRRGGARAVIFDILYTENSVYGPEDDGRLARAVAAAGNVVLPVFLSREEKPANPLEGEILAKAGLDIPGPAPPEFPRYRSLLSPIAPLAAAAGNLGNVECGPDPDGIYRRVPLVVPFRDRWLPMVPFAAFQRFGNEGGWRFEAGALAGERLRLPLDHQGRVFLKFRGPTRSHKRLAAANVIQSEARLRHGQPPFYAPEELAGKWVLVGLTAPGLLDLKACPVSAIYPGVELHATLLDNLLQGDFLRPAPWWLAWVWAVLLALGVGAAVLFSHRLLTTLAAFFVLATLHLSLTVLAFRLDWWSDPVLPGATLGLAFALSTAYSYATEGRQKLYIRRMFAQYMSEAVISHLLANPEKLKLGGERRRVTLFFSDLAGFTSLSEKLPPEDLVALLNDYLSRMTEIILEEEGTVDKFEGDAIMAFWGAPLDQDDQALLACRAALRQVAGLEKLNQEFLEQELPPLGMRIGLHTGEAVVGNLGSDRRFDYTVIGDTVNLASRLEGLNKFYGTAILASEVTVTAAGGEVEFMEVDRVAVKGREAPVAVFTVLGVTGELTAEAAAARQSFARGLSLYRDRDFAAGAHLFQESLKYFADGNPAAVFLRRCQEFQAAPPPPEWDAVFRPEGK